MSKQKINDDQAAIWLEQVCPSYDVCDISHGDQLETFNLTVCKNFNSHRCNSLTNGQKESPG